MRTVAYVACVLVSIGAFCGVAGAAVTHPTAYAAALATHPLGSDTTLSDPDWARGRITQDDVPFHDITTRALAPFKTTAYLLYDAANLYIGFDVQQPRLPITATQTTNDVGFGLDDFVGIGIDTSGNGATVYYFSTTPRGTRYEEASESTRYQPLWHVAARRDGARWKAVLTIPLKALHTSSAATQSWRFNFVRGVAAVGDHYTWAYDGTMQDGSTPQWPPFGDSQFWPHLTGLRNLASSGFGDRARANIYGLGSAGGNRKLFEQANGTFAPETQRVAGIDLSYALTNTIHFVSTVNPDFSNVETDQQSIAPQEFRRVLTEYRPFFAEGNSFLSPTSPSGGAFTPNNQIFYSPSIGPFDRGAKLEGSFGQQSFGVLSFRGYDETTNNEFDDIAYGYTHATPSQTFAYWSDGVLAHHSSAGDDTSFEAGTNFHNLHTGLAGGIDEAFESGSYVPDPGHARQLNIIGEMRKPNYDLVADWEDVTPNYNPIDGYTGISDIRGWVDAINLNGSSPGIKSYTFTLGSDRFYDDSEAIHQADVLAMLTAHVNQLSMGFGPRTGELRSYSQSAPGPLGCDDPALVRTSYTGFPPLLLRRDRPLQSADAESRLPRRNARAHRFRSRARAVRRRISAPIHALDGTPARNAPIAFRRVRGYLWPNDRERAAQFAMVAAHLRGRESRNRFERVARVALDQRGCRWAHHGSRREPGGELSSQVSQRRRTVRGVRNAGRDADHRPLHREVHPAPRCPNLAPSIKQDVGYDAGSDRGVRLRAARRVLSDLTSQENDGFSFRGTVASDLIHFIESLA